MTHEGTRSSDSEARLGHGVMTRPPGDEALLRTYVGPRGDYYLERWRGLMDGTSKLAGFNWAAFLLALPWLFLRRMPVAGIAFTAILGADVLVEELLLPSRAISSATSLLFAIVVGCYANRWYYLRASRMVAEARHRFVTEEEQLEFLSRRGGRSFLAAVVGPSVCLAVLMGPFLLLFPGEYGERICCGDDCEIEIYVDGEASEDDAGRLCAVLKEVGYAEGQAGASVRIVRASDRPLIVGFVFHEGTWNDPLIIQFCELVGSMIADAGLGRPVIVQMCNEHFEPQKAIRVN